MILDEIIAKRKIQLDREKSKAPLEAVKKQAYECSHKIIDFKSALKQNRLSVIAEVKKASPSKGLIRPDFSPVDIAREYEAAGANAVSCLTEEHYFQGSSDYLRAIRAEIKIPILRKDFIFDEYQIYEARAMGADAVLLIAAVLDTETLCRYRKLAESLGLFVLAETHNEEELKSVLAAGCEIIGINNRNLKTFEVSLETTKHLAGLVPDGKIIVSESGIATNEDMKQLRSYKADAVLIGETLMRSDSITDSLNALRAGI